VYQVAGRLVCGRGNLLRDFKKTCFNIFKETLLLETTFTDLMRVHCDLVPIKRNLKSKTNKSYY
jgi:hypothetical protein